MKSLRTLIKLSSQRLDELRRDLNVFLDKKDDLIVKKLKLEEDLVKEQECASKSLEASFAYPAFAIGVKVEQENIDNFVVKLDEEINTLTAKISIAFSELKKYEIMLAKKEKELLAEQSRKDRINLDEISMVGHQRKKKVKPS